MHDHYITVREFALLIAVFVGPVLIAAGVAQFLLLRHARLRPSSLLAILTSAAVVTLLVAWGLAYIVPTAASGTYGGVLVFPAVLAAIIVTLGIAAIARRRRPAA